MQERKLQQIRRLVLRGWTWRAAAERARVPKTTAYMAALARWPDLRKRRDLTATERRRIRRAIANGASCRAVARRFQRSPSTVSRIRARMLARAAGPAVVRICRRYRCPHCGALLNVAPCLACLLEERNGPLLQPGRDHDL